MCYLIWYQNIFSISLVYIRFCVIRSEPGTFVMETNNTECLISLEQQEFSLLDLKVLSLIGLLFKRKLCVQQKLSS